MTKRDIAASKSGLPKKARDAVVAKKAGTAKKVPARNALLVMGMHRSGTSALSRVLSLRGASLPEKLVPANYGNKTGYWEPQSVVDLNDRMLAFFGVAWDDPFAARQLPKPEAFPARFRKQARDILDVEYGDFDLFVLKDPRCTLLHGFWRNIMEAASVRECPIVIARPFEEVADSLLRRDSTSVVASVLLYVTYGLEAAAAVAGGASVVTYDQLTNDWLATTDRIAREQRFTWPRIDVRMQGDIDNFLSPSNQTKRQLRIPAELRSWATSVWSWMAARSNGDQVELSELESVRRELSRAMNLFSPLIADRKRKMEELERTIDKERAQVRQTVEMLDESNALLERTASERDTALAERDKALGIYQEANEQASAIRDRLKQLENDLQTARNELSDRDREKAELKENLAALQARSEQSQADLIRQRDQLHDLYKESQEALRHARQSYQRQESESRALRESLQDAEAHGKQAGDAMRVLQERLEAVGHEADRERNEMQSRIGDVTAERDELRQQLDRKTAAYEGLSHSNRGLEQQLAVRNEDLKVLELDREELRQQLDVRVAAYEELSRGKHELEEQIVALTSNAAEMDSERGRILGKMQEEFSANKELSDANADLMRQLSEVKKSLGEVESDREQLRKRLEYQSAANDELASNNSELDQQLSAIKEDLSRVASEREQLRQQIADKAVESGDLMRVNHELERRLADAVAQVASARDERGQLMAAYHEAQTSLASALVQAANAADERARLMLTYRETDALLHRTEEQYSKLDREHARLRQELLGTEQEKSSLAKAIAEIHSSHSWLVTAPLRAVGKLGRRVVGGKRNAPLLLPAPDWSRNAVAPKDGREATATGMASIEGRGPLHREHAGLRQFLGAEFGERTMHDVLSRIDFYRLPIETDIVRSAARVECSDAEASAWMRRLASRAAGSEVRGRNPDVSIVVPVYNQLPFTLACLDALLAHESRYSFEILVGDDASTDGTALALNIPVDRVRHVRHAGNLGFVRNCNATAAEAKGRFVVFLNNDTQVLPNWLDELVGTLEDDPAIGLSGSKLVFPDGRMQECGAIVWKDGSAWNFGRLDDPRKPEYCYRRDVDFVSGASIALRRETWQLLGGFDELYVPAYAEDADLAFRVRAHGLRTVVQPLSQVLHFEGVSSGTDLGSGAKAHQVENLKKLFERWRDVLADHRPNATEPELEKERSVSKRLLFVDLVTPTPNEDAGSLVAFEMMRAFRSQGFKITFIPADNFAHMGATTRDLQRIGIETIYHPSYSSMDDFLAERDDPFDVILLVRFQVGEAHMKALHRRYPAAKIIFSNCDLHYLREMREAEVAKDPAATKAALETKRRELAVIGGCDLNLVHSQAELELLQADAPGAPCVLFPLVHDPIDVCAPLSRRDGACFVGGYRHAPNADGIAWFVDKIWPTVVANDPSQTLYIAGSSMPPEVKALGSRPNVEVVGFVEDLEGFLAKRRVALAPLRFGAGAKGKVAVSLANGVPVVSTAVGTEGMQLEPGANVLVADSEKDFAAAVLSLLTDDNRWHELSAAGMRYAEEVTSRASAGKRVAGILERFGLGT